MYVKYLYFQIFLHHLAIRMSESWRPFIFEFRNFTTQSLSKVIDMNSSVSNDGVSLYVNILEPLPNLYGRLVLTFESANEVYDMEFINRTIDFCEFLRNRRYEPILQIFYKMLNNTNSDAARSCPIPKNTALDAENFPPVMPNKKGFFECDLMVMYGRQMKTVSRINLYFEFKNAKT